MMCPVQEQCACCVAATLACCRSCATRSTIRRGRSLHRLVRRRRSQRHHRAHPRPVPSEQLGQQFIVEDHVGAGGNIGMQDVLASTPDGYTIGFVAPNNAINQTLYQHIPFDFVRDSTPIAGTMKLANVMDVNLDFPAKTLAEFIAMAKSAAGQDQFCLRRGGHLAAHVRRAVGDHDRHKTHPRGVSRHGAGDDRSARRPDPGAVRQPSGPDPADQGRQHPRARRHHEGTRGILPDVPTIGETVPGYEVSCGSASAGRKACRRKSSPSSTPPSMRRWPTRAEDRFHELGGEVMPMSPAAFGKLVADETAKWAKVVKSAGLKVE